MKTLSHLNRLDCYQIRGRRIDVMVGIHVGRFKHETFIVLDSNGILVKVERKGYPLP